MFLSGLIAIECLLHFCIFISHILHGSHCLVEGATYPWHCIPVGDRFHLAFIEKPITNTAMNHQEYVNHIVCLADCNPGINSSSPGQNDRLFADGIFRCVSVNQMFWLMSPVHWRIYAALGGDELRYLYWIKGWAISHHEQYNAEYLKNIFLNLRH